ncbi:MAG: bifunctional 4-hydroxy-2-oxoglutarate aldolase/2-dehydro-3-deoxy-phosphogluconate aldolase [Acidobacteriota bacterium]|nr:bifunctional 4-hydroxy-2-oxoglutarate aldolase/2-dehydro-3-deoxy-phosphogluconate aldolase [Acidobacteriota bacterium]
MSVTLADITRYRIIPVVVVNDAANAAGLGAALVAGGLPVAEVTFRTAAAADTIKILAERGDIIVGAGTVRNPAQVDQAVDAGATFIVSPGLRSDVVLRAQEIGIPVLPGVATPSEIMLAEQLGLNTVKFFPANVYGGAAGIKSLSAPFIDINFIPSGGVSAANLGEFLALPCIPAVGGSWMVPAKAVDAGDFGRVETLTRESMDLVSALAGGNN